MTASEFMGIAPMFASEDGSRKSLGNSFRHGNHMFVTDGRIALIGSASGLDADEIRVTADPSQKNVGSRLLDEDLLLVEAKIVNGAYVEYDLCSIGEAVCEVFASIEPEMMYLRMNEPDPEYLDHDGTPESVRNVHDKFSVVRRIAAGAKRYWGIDLKPFIVRFNRNCDAESIDEPISCITVKEHHALCTPIVLDHFKGGEVQDGSRPIGAQTTHDRFSVVQPFVMDMSHPGDKRDERRVTGQNEPLKTVKTRNNAAIVQPLVLGQQGGATCRPISEPCPTIACGGAIRGIFPQLADGRIIDIRMRMLRPDELAAAHSFPKDYIITGNRSQKVKQIGNSVPVRTAKAMCAADLPRKDAKC